MFDKKEYNKEYRIKNRDKIIEYKKKYYYVAAEMENLRKRTAKEKEKFIKYGNEKILSSLLEVMDNFDRTLNAFEGNEDSKVKVVFQDYCHPKYSQLFGEFESHLSIIDLLFNCGPNSKEVLMSGNLTRDRIIGS